MNLIQKAYSLWAYNLGWKKYRVDENKDSFKLK